MSYPTVYSTDFPFECRHIELKKCSICLTKYIPPVNRNGVPITRQSKYNERKTCGDECYRVSKQTNNAKLGRPRIYPVPETGPSAMDRWLQGRRS